ncbi:hypothetical protein [Pseudomonas syringae]|uniref:hypothetical protein n=1 Tax=Pseudomonas syringae TaxID=317 RepID=UPI001F366A22|nr:hypothetical protein [Pseudomonas syringae]MCF5371959.1 hypothetical protein [Pseudomonas syringae]MCF5382044.1 hypothetical protein [Pseudomonas syringae]MCF5419422.1 hypothetical protein [Pseudomonas syringae]MCF5451969.1 hypothetical protein [Pseudomonas syringae]MCF5458753.1 hypothetical protein [Pseudomonas syringae]
MMSSRTDAGIPMWKFIVGFIAVVCLIFLGLTLLTGIGAHELIGSHRPIMLGPALVLAVWVIESKSVPLPYRFENTWPLIAAGFWVGICRVIVMKTEADGTPDILGHRMDLLGMYPWYAETWFLWAGLTVIICGGYFIRHRASV